MPYINLCDALIYAMHSLKRCNHVCNDILIMHVLHPSQKVHYVMQGYVYIYKALLRWMQYIHHYIHSYIM